MKKTLSILLSLLLALSLLPGGALAAEVRLSPQSLRVDGKTVECEKYNIDGSNYFKLRDVAMLLSGTGSRFSVGWDAGRKVVSVTTGEAYEPNGSELDLSGGDKSATAVPSTQTLWIDGVERSDLSAWNIGGNNFFKLRDLGDALGFRVDYDEETNTAVVTSRSVFGSAADMMIETARSEGRWVAEGGYYAYEFHAQHEKGQVMSFVLAYAPEKGELRLESISEEPAFSLTVCMDEKLTSPFLCVFRDSTMAEYACVWRWDFSVVPAEFDADVGWETGVGEFTFSEENRLEGVYTEPPSEELQAAFRQTAINMAYVVFQITELFLLLPNGFTAADMGFTCVFS